MFVNAPIPYGRSAAGGEIGEPLSELRLSARSRVWVYGTKCVLDIFGKGVCVLSGVSGNPDEEMDEQESMMLGVELTDWGDLPILSRH